MWGKSLQILNAVSRGSEPAILAGIDLERGSLSAFENCFRRFKLKVKVCYITADQKLDKTRFDGCVLRIDDRAPEILARVRSSALNRSSLAYGIGNTEAASKVAHLGLNAMVPSLEESEVLKAAEVTYLLLVRKLRRFVRVPIVTQVQIETPAQSITGLTRDIGAGGMALQIPPGVRVPGKVTVSFVLPGLAPITVPAFPCWYSGDAVGLQFAGSEDLKDVKDWVDRYLGGA